jgi:hypothetical protein
MIFETPTDYGVHVNLNSFLSLYTLELEVNFIYFHAVVIKYDISLQIWGS